MRNLKKILALVLALVMSMSLVSMANAAFVDDADITNDQAVNALVSLGVIDGVGGNKFNPAGTVTRAQMAKMITIISLGNVDITAFEGTATDLTDIGGHWAEAYIKFCYSQGIIAGKGNGIFAPNANVTAVEAAKMLLTGIGYNAKVQGYVGTAEWAINVTRDAQLAGFYKNLSVKSGDALTRDQAAQMIWNAIQTATIVKTSMVDRETGKITDNYGATGANLLEKTFNVDTTIGTLVGNTYDAETGKFTYGIDTDLNGTSDVTFTSTEDFTALYLQNVKALSTVTTSGVKLYGIYTNKGGVVATAPYVKVANGAANSDSIKVNGTAIKVDSDDEAKDNLRYYEVKYGMTVDTSTANEPALENVVTFVDYDGDGEIDLGYFTPVTYGSVSYVGTKSYTVSAGLNGTLGGVQHNFTSKTVNEYEGIAKDDQIAVVAGANTFKNVAEISKLTVETGKVTATDGTTKVMINDTWYTISSNTSMLGNSYKFAAVNGVIVYVTSAGTDKLTADKYVVVTDTQAAGGFQANHQAKVLKSDGTTEILNLEAISGSALATADDASTPSTDELADSLTALAGTEGNIYVLADADKDSKYELVNVAYDTTSGFAGGSTGTAVSNKKVGSYAIADDAIVFNQKTNGTYIVTTGAELKKTTATVDNYWYSTSKTTGFSTVVLAYVKGENLTSTSDWLYGYVTGNIILEKNSSNADIAKVTFWDGTATQTLYTDSSNDTVLTAKGQAFKYKLNNSGAMTSISKLSNENTVMAWDGTNIEFEGSWVAELKDAKIIYVDTANKAGVEGGSIALATKKDGVNFDKNVLVDAAVVNSKNTVYVVFVDVANDYTYVA